MYEQISIVLYYGDRKFYKIYPIIRYNRVRYLRVLLNMEPRYAEFTVWGLKSYLTFRGQFRRAWSFRRPFEYFHEKITENPSTDNRFTSLQFPQRFWRKPPYISDIWATHRPRAKSGPRDVPIRPAANFRNCIQSGPGSYFAIKYGPKLRSQCVKDIYVIYPWYLLSHPIERYREKSFLSPRFTKSTKAWAAAFPTALDLAWWLEKVAHTCYIYNTYSARV